MYGYAINPHLTSLTNLNAKFKKMCTFLSKGRIGSDYDQSEIPDPTGYSMAPTVPRSDPNPQNCVK